MMLFLIRTTWFSISSSCDVYCGDFTVDLNGDKGPNAVGRDIFSFYITNKGIKPAGLPFDPIRHFPEFCRKVSDDKYNGLACTAWVIYNENMDYLRCDGLSWNGKKSV